MDSLGHIQGLVEHLDTAVSKGCQAQADTAGSQDSAEHILGSAENLDVAVSQGHSLEPAEPLERKAIAERQE